MPRASPVYISYLTYVHACMCTCTHTHTQVNVHHPREDMWSAKHVYANHAQGHVHRTTCRCTSCLCSRHAHVHTHTQQAWKFIYTHILWFIFTSKFLCNVKRKYISKKYYLHSNNLHKDHDYDVKDTLLNKKLECPTH